MKVSSKIQMVVFCLFIFVFFTANLINKDKEFSERENRALAQKPKFSLTALTNGTFTKDFESYITDQFVLRDQWTTLKAATETAIGKEENKGVYLCDDDVLISRFDKPDEALFERNVSYINSLANNSGDANVYFELIPGASSIWSDKLPANAPNVDQQKYIDDAYSKVSAITVDAFKALSAHKNEKIYYSTDHHWTSLGAYYSYAELMSTMGLEANPIDSYDRQIVSDSFYGTVYSSSGYSWVAPEEIEIFVPETDAVITNYGSGTAKEGVLYDYSKLDVKDKYSFFLGGISSLITVETGKADAPSLLIIRDSYNDSRLPFLLDHFSDIHIIDLRYYKLSIADYIAKNDIDNVLVSYSVDNFSSDINVFLAAR